MYPAQHAISVTPTDNGTSAFLPIYPSRWSGASPAGR
jgi:hypothetical protein